MLATDFIIHFSDLEDPRINNLNSKHIFEDILILGFIANLYSCDTWVKVEQFCN